MNRSLKSGSKLHALQTLRDGKRPVLLAKRLECVRLADALGSRVQREIEFGEVSPRLAGYLFSVSKPPDMDAGGSPIGAQSSSSARYGRICDRAELELRAPDGGDQRRGASAAEVAALSTYLPGEGRESGAGNPVHGPNAFETTKGDFP